MKDEPKHITIKEWAEDDRPREKLLAKGAKHLSDAELLALLLGSGSGKLTAVDLAKNILRSANNNLLDFGKTDISELKKVKGIGDAKAVCIVAAIELGSRVQASMPTKQTIVDSSSIVYNYVRSSFFGLKSEEFWVLLLNRRNAIIDFFCLSKGGTAGTVVDVKLILKKAIEKTASGLIVTHNHPSGNLQASTADKQITKKIKEGAALLDITLLDHLIITDTAYLSFADENIL
jgi:DNA repair protein RadC